MDLATDTVLPSTNNIDTIKLVSLPASVQELFPIKEKTYAPTGNIAYRYRHKNSKLYNMGWHLTRHIPMTQLRAHFFQHVPFEGLGSIAQWLKDNGYAVSSTRFYEPEYQLPALDEVDLLVVMGGPMSVNDTMDFPWLSDEKAFIQQFIAMGAPVLGICLGAQLMAASLGAAIYPNDEKEIGWLPINCHSFEDGEVFAFPDSASVFHWHGETFDLPEGASLLASSKACVNQAFQYGERAIGLQFHLETTPESAQAIVTHCADELVPAPYIQDADTILNAHTDQYEEINALMAKVLSFITRH